VGTVMSRLCRARRALKERLFDLNPAHDDARNRIRRIK
jgi:DNA-directed RNA polymerase specialized sigma24 family protein